MAKKEPRGPVLTPIMVKSIIELATEATIKAYHREEAAENKRKRDRYLHNTKFMLQNYRDWVQHSENAVYDTPQLSQEEEMRELEAMMAGKDAVEDTRVESIEREARRTRIMVAHLREMMSVYEFSCKRSKRNEEMRRFRTINRFYIEEKDWTPQDIADDEGVDISTVYKDLREGIKRITALVFGVDGILV